MLRLRHLRSDLDELEESAASLKVSAPQRAMLNTKWFMFGRSNSHKTICIGDTVTLLCCCLMPPHRP
jgi:hypothetical protein